MAKSIPKVDGMDWILENFSQPLIHPDEFTAKMVVDSSGASLTSVRTKLKKMVKNGDITIRQISMDGNITNVYKRVTVTG
jgi:hypothetical protein